MVSRADRSRFAEWLWTVDHYLLAAFGLLMVGGVVLSFAASPPVAERLGLDTFFFVKRQALFLIPAVARRTDLHRDRRRGTDPVRDFARAAGRDPVHRL